MKLEEVQAAFTDNPELKGGLIGILKDDFLSNPPEGVIVRTQEQDKTFLNNHLNTILPGKVEEKFSAKFKENLDQMDTMVTDLTGEKKGPHEKTTDFIKRGFEAIKGKTADPVTKQKVHELENLVATTRADYEQKLSEKESEMFKSNIAYQIKTELDRASLAVPMHLKTEAEKQDFVNSQKGLIEQGFLGKFTPKKDEQGQIVFHEGDTPLLRAQDGKPKTAGELLTERYAAWFMPQGKQATGTGMNFNGSQNGGAISSKEAIHNHLKASGLDPELNEDAYMNQFKKLAKENAIEI